MNHYFDASGAHSDAAISKPLDWRKAFERLEGAFAPATMRSYILDMRTFCEWCQERSIAALPATAETLCAFLEDQSKFLKPVSMKRRVYAIRKAHRLLHLPDPTEASDVDLALRRIRRSHANRPQQAKGMTRTYLDRFIAALPRTPWGMRDRAILSLGYDLLTRRSELVALRSDDLEFLEDGTLRVLIRRSKTDPMGMGRVAFSSRRSAALVKAWLDWRGPAIEPLFCAIYQNVPLNRALSACRVKTIIKEAAEAAGLSQQAVSEFSGHSLRVGAAQDLFRAGHDMAAIMRAGGWKSVNVLGRYLELAEHNVWTHQTTRQRLCRSIAAS